MNGWKKQWRQNCKWGSPQKWKRPRSRRPFEKWACGRWLFLNLPKDQSDWALEDSSFCSWNYCPFSQWYCNFWDSSEKNVTNNFPLLFQKKKMQKVNKLNICVFFMSNRVIPRLIEAYTMSNKNKTSQLKIGRSWNWLPLHYDISKVLTQTTIFSSCSFSSQEWNISREKNLLCHVILEIFLKKKNFDFFSQIELFEPPGQWQP